MFPLTPPQHTCKYPPPCHHNLPTSNVCKKPGDRQAACPCLNSLTSLTTSQVINPVRISPGPDEPIRLIYCLSISLPPAHLGGSSSHNNTQIGPISPKLTQYFTCTRPPSHCKLHAALMWVGQQNFLVETEQMSWVSTC